jgi:hypothetical protein
MWRGAEAPGVCTSLIRGGGIVVETGSDKIHHRGLQFDQRCSSHCSRYPVGFRKQSSECRNSRRACRYEYAGSQHGYTAAHRLLGSEVRKTSHHGYLRLTQSLHAKAVPAQRPVGQACLLAGCVHVDRSRDTGDVDTMVGPHQTL